MTLMAPEGGKAGPPALRETGLWLADVARRHSLQLDVQLTVLLPSHQAIGPITARLLTVPSIID